VSSLSVPPVSPGVTFSIRLPPHLREQLEKIADNEASCVSAVIRRAATLEVDRVAGIRARRDKRRRQRPPLPTGGAANV
jgi:hypothetical protein